MGRARVSAGAAPATRTRTTGDGRAKTARCVSLRLLG